MNDVKLHKIAGKFRVGNSKPTRCMTLRLYSLRAVLYMAAFVATQHNPHLKAFYQRLQDREKPKCPRSGRSCENWFICASAFLKPGNLISLIMEFQLDF